MFRFEVLNEQTKIELSIREQLERDIEQFFKNGGEIEKLEGFTEVSPSKPCFYHDFIGG